MARFALLACAALAATSCATSGAVPRPFPGAPVVTQPTGPESAVPAASTPPPPTAVATPPAIAAVVPPPSTTAPPGSTPGALALAQALQFRGVRYRLGGSDPTTGFDCSGLVQYVFARQGIAMPRETRFQFQVGYEIDASEIRPGDLFFFNTDADGASHVGIAIDTDAFVHAPNSRGVVRVERISTPYWSRRFLGARRIE